MLTDRWYVDGVHAGKRLRDLPFTYLLWFVGSHQMRRSKWPDCQVALQEIRRRLTASGEDVELELLSDLRPKSREEKLLIKARRRAYTKSIKL
jgi:uncharacterized protein (DUF3820 family)